MVSTRKSTYHMTSQVISPTRARTSPQVETSTAVQEQEPAPSADETLVRTIAAAVAHALAAVPTAAPQPRSQRPLVQLGQSLASGPSPSRPQRNLASELDASVLTDASVPVDAVTPYGTSTRLPAETSTPPPSVYEHSSSIIPPKSADTSTMGGWQAGQITLASTKFDGRVENWTRWKTEMQTILHWQGLLQLVQGREQFDAERAQRDADWKNCFETRERKAHTEIVLSLHGDLLDRFKTDIETANPAQVWGALLRTYDGTQGTNAVYLKQDLYARRLRQGEGVMDYVGDLQRMRRELERMEIIISEGEMASIVLSNSVVVYPSIANDHTQRVSRLRGGFDKEQRVQDAVNLLLVAERTARDQLSRGGRDAGQGLQRQVNLVTRGSPPRGAQQQSGGKRRYSGNGGRGAGKKKKRNEDEARKRREEIAEKKRNSECNACHKQGHWWKECPSRKSTDVNEIRTMAGVVLRHMDSERGSAAEGSDHQSECPRVDIVQTHPVQLSVARQREDARSYSKVYTRHELAALVGRDFEERLVRARDSQREERSIEYSPTSPPDDDDSDTGGAGLPVVRRAMALKNSVPQDSVPADEIEWILDSGAQINVTGELHLLNNVTELQQPEVVESATGTYERIAVMGSVILPVVNAHNDKTEMRLLEDVRYCPGSKVNLISQTYMQFDCGYKLCMSEDQRTTWLVKPDMKLKFELVDGLYRMRVKRQNKLVLGVQKPATDASVMELLHNRLNHVSMSTIKQMVADKVDFGVKVNMNVLSLYDCVPCIESKMKRMTYTRNPRRATKPLEKISADVCTINEIAADKSTMFLLVMDEYSRYKWVYLLQHKADACQHIQLLMLRLGKQFKKYEVVVFHADGGGEFVSNELKAFCAKEGVTMKYTHADSPEENGIVERANGVIVSRVRSMLDATRLPNLLWGEALLHAVDTLNVCPSSALDGCSSHERLHGTRPDLRALRTWGCMAHVHIADASRQRKEKLQTRVRTCILLGYATDKKGYKLLDVKTGAVVTARAENIRFHEAFTVEGGYIDKLLQNTFFRADHELPSHVPVVRIKTGMHTYMSEADAGRAPIAIVDDDSGTCVRSNGEQRQPAKATSTRAKRKRTARDDAELIREACKDLDWTPPLSAREAGPFIRRTLAKRRRKPSTRLKDYVVGSVRVHEDVVVPTTYKQARASPQWLQWLQAMEEELASLRAHGTWKLVRRTDMKGRKAITCRWVYAVKRNERGEIMRFKARLVIHGFKQRAGLEYTETYAPVIRFETIRSAIYFALQRGWAILQYDVKTAFLYGHLDELIFMEQPQGFQSQPDVFVCRLLRSLYGLRQAPNVWNRTLHKALQQLGFTRLDSDYGLYARKVGDPEEITMLLTVYVDDVLLLGPPALCRSIALQLAKQFELTELGPVKYLLGVEILIDPTKKTVAYSQRQHVQDILKRFNMAACNGCTTPEATVALQVKAPSDQTYLPYRELVGALQYLVSASRPDIAHAVRNLGKYLSDYSYEHYFMAKRVLRYLAHTVDYGLVNDVGRGCRVALTCFTDADYANDADDRKSVSGYVTMLDGNVVSYASRKQAINAQSTTEAEYVAMNEGTKDLLWMLGLCVELNWEVEGPVLYGDNRGSIYLAAKPGKHSKTKHIENKYHLVRHLVESGRLTTEHVGTNDMVADVMTKALGRVKFERCRDMLKVLPLSKFREAEPRSSGSISQDNN